MIEWYLSTLQIFKDIKQKAADALDAVSSKKKDSKKKICEYLNGDIEKLIPLWEQKAPLSELGDLRRHISWGEEGDFKDILAEDLPVLEKRIEDLLRSSERKASNRGRTPEREKNKVKKVLVSYISIS